MYSLAGAWISGNQKQTHSESSTDHDHSIHIIPHLPDLLLVAQVALGLDDGQHEYCVSWHRFDSSGVFHASDFTRSACCDSSCACKHHVVQRTEDGCDSASTDSTHYAAYMAIRERDWCRRLLHAVSMVSIMKHLIGRVWLVIALLCAVSADILACPGCKDGFASGPNAGLGEAYSWSILFMLAVPTTIVTVFTVFIVRRLKKNSNG